MEWCNVVKVGWYREMFQPIKLGVTHRYRACRVRGKQCDVGRTPFDLAPQDLVGNW
jgi:hypothetical protein